MEWLCVLASLAAQVGIAQWVNLGFVVVCLWAAFGGSSRGVALASAGLYLALVVL